MSSYLWENMTERDRVVLVKQCGWITAKGYPSRTGWKVVHAGWAELSPAARTVLTRYIGE